MLVSCVAALGAGYSKSYGTLMTARIFQAMGISTGLTVPGAVVVDIFTSEERGRKNGIWAQFVALGPAVSIASVQPPRLTKADRCARGWPTDSERGLAMVYVAC